MKIHHVALIVSSIQKSIEFYERTLGFKVIAKTYREERNSWKVDLRCHDVQLELFTFPGAPERPSYPEAQGLRHLAFSVSNLSELHQNLKNQGIEVEEIRADHLTGKKFFFFSDPDGQPLEIYED